MIDLQQRCSFSAAHRADDLSGTAPAARRFLLVEQPGAWGRLAMEESGLDREVGLALSRACGTMGTRPLLIRRPGRAPVPTRKRWYLAETTPGQASLQTGTIGADTELPGILADAEAGHAVGSAVDAPLYAVCTHGRHDACCAIKGRPVAAALAARLGDGAWEVSHLGGDRFAGNVLVLPWGLYYGRIDVLNALELASATAAGQIAPPFFRGRSAFSPPVQAAQAHAMARSGCVGIDAHAPVQLRRVADAEPFTGRRFEVLLRGPDPGDAPWRITVERQSAGPPSLLTCAATSPMSPPRWELIDLVAP